MRVVQISSSKVGAADPVGFAARAEDEDKRASADAWSGANRKWYPANWQHNS